MCAYSDVRIGKGHARHDRQMSSRPSPTVRPFLKWAGNKYRILAQIKAALPPGRRLIEPFVGSGAVFANTDYARYLLADVNPDLIALYRHLQDEGPRFIEYCRSYFTAENNTSAAYYDLRARFNEMADVREKAALFVYLNRHCYNGLCRYNAGGGFNVPFGRYRKPYFPAAEMAHFHERARRAEFVCAAFGETMAGAQPGDAVYCDPPYAPLSATANFTSYSPQQFGVEEQRELARLAEKLASRGVSVIISNHDTDFTRREYAQARIVTFDVRRTISCDGASRGHAQELLAVFGGQEA